MTFGLMSRKPNPALLALAKRPKTSASPIRTNQRRKISLPNTTPRNTVHRRITVRAVTVLTAAMIGAATVAVAGIARISAAVGAVSVVADAAAEAAISARVAVAIFHLPNTLRRRVASAVRIGATIGVMTIAATTEVNAVIADAAIRIAADTTIAVRVAISIIAEAIPSAHPRLAKNKFCFRANHLQSIVTAR
jgi:hypothetical protein